MVALCRCIVEVPRLQSGVLAVIPTHRWPARAVLLALALLMPGLTAPAAAAPKTDIVVLKNGDHLTCEIQRLTRGKLRVKTDDMGTVDIEWDKIASLAGKGLFEIENLAGHLYFGPLDTVPDEGLQVATATGIQTVPLASIFRIMAIKTSFWKRLSGNVDLGFGYTKATELTDFTADLSVKFARPTFSAELAGSSLIQRQNAVDERTRETSRDTTRNSLSFTYTRSFENRRFAMGRLTGDQNRELGYELRAGVAGAWGKYLLRSQGNEIGGGVGLYANREIPVDGETVDNLEALIAVDWANFSYDFPKTDIEIASIFIMGLTDWGRYRVDLDARLNRELFKDFSFVIKGYYSYDSRPPTKGSSRDDYQVSLALGYAF